LKRILAIIFKILAKILKIMAKICFDERRDGRQPHYADRTKAMCSLCDLCFLCVEKKQAKVSNQEYGWSFHILPIFIEKLQNS